MVVDVMLVKRLPVSVQSGFTGRQARRFDAHDTVSASLELAAALVRETRFRKEVVAARLEDGFLDATTLMEHLIAKGTLGCGRQITRQLASWSG